MRPEITRREVLNNLIRFKDSLLEKLPKKHSGGERVYKVLLNRKTGEMRFPQKIKSLEYQVAKRKGKLQAPNDWKEARIVVKDHFELRNGQNHPLEPTEVDPPARRVIRETLEVLNSRAQAVQGIKLLEEEVLQDLSSIDFAVEVERIEDLPAWVGSLNREEAEKRLEGKAEGTYLIREGDPITRAIGFHFAEENHLLVHPFLLTVVEDEEKISDILIIQTSKGWTQYQDDPNLNDTMLYQYEATPDALLRGLMQIIKEPISS